MIEKEISIVMQGAYFKNNTVSTCLFANDIKSTFPNIELILSTWEGTKIDFPEIYDHIVYSQDPGSVVNPYSLKPLNVNRQTVSTLNGLKKTSRKYAIKMRTDCNITDYNLIYNINNERRRLNHQKTAICKEKVIISNITTKIPKVDKRNSFHFSDWIYIGLKEDLINLFSIEEYSILKYPLKDNNLFSIAAEQHIIISFLEKNDYKNIDLNNILLHNEIMFNNFIVMTATELGLICHKRWYKSPFGDNGYNAYTKYDWLIGYQKYFNTQLPYFETTFNLDFLINKIMKKYYYLKHKCIRLLISLKIVIK